MTSRIRVTFRDLEHPTQIASAVIRVGLNAERENVCELQAIQWTTVPPEQYAKEKKVLDQWPTDTILPPFTTGRRLQAQRTVGLGTRLKRFIAGVLGGIDWLADLLPVFGRRRFHLGWTVRLRACRSCGKRAEWIDRHIRPTAFKRLLRI